LIEFIADTFQLEKGVDYHYRLSLGDRSDEKKYFKDDASWDFAENLLREVLTERKAHFVEAPGEAAFYGPKIDIQMKNVNGKEDTAFTVQYDFVMPKRFGLSYINEEGSEEEPVVVHRSSIGAIERVMAFLIEKYGGAFPIWLSPVQIAVLPVSDKVFDYAQGIAEELRISGIRVELNSTNETIGAKIREATLQKIPYMCIIGEKEKSLSDSDGKKHVTVRSRSGQNLGVLELESFKKRIAKEIETKV
jgi:threonyl-tRNA synthetase